MASEHLNFFEPWPDLRAHHENQLTRAFLVVLSMSPLAHEAWLKLVAPDLDLARLPGPSFETQRATLTRGDDAEPRSAEIDPVRGISVFQAADAPEQAIGPVTQSHRHAIYDGVVHYGDELVIVLEVKPGPYSDDRQSREVNLGGAQILLDEMPRHVDWRMLLEVWGGLHRHHHLAGAEERIVSDFLEFVDRHHPHLGPFSKLGLCGRDPWRLLRRLRTVLEDSAGGEKPAEIDGEWARLELPGARSVRYAFLAARDSEGPGHIAVDLFPSDTLTQARVLFGERSNRVAALRALADEHWTIKPNFHLGYRQTGLGWTDSPCGLEAYLDYWTAAIGHTRELPREEWPGPLAELVAEGVVPADYPNEFDRLAVRRARLHPRPGLHLWRTWPLDDADRLDDRSHLAPAVTGAINEVLTSLSEPELPSVSSTQ